MAFLQTAIQTAHHFQASYKPNTAVTDWIERLCSSSYKVTEYEGIPELVDSINLQATGPSEAARMLRKKLKYGNTHMQLRAIFIIKCLVENCGERTNFAKNFPDPTFVERMKILAGDPQTDPTVKKHLMSTLKGFHAQYKEDRSMRVYAQWWDEVGGARGEEDERARQAYQKERERLDKEQQLRLDEKMAARLQGEEDEHAAKLREKRRKMKELAEADARAKEAAEKLRGEERARAEAREEERREYERKKAEKKKNSFWSMGDSSSSTTAQKTGTTAKRAPFNFEAEKPKISQAVATASMYANGLVNALQRVNREQESVASNTQVQDQLFKLKETRKVIVRYIHLCEVDKEGEYIGMLISSNDQIIAALRLYDRMLTKPADEDSDDDEAVQTSRAAATNTTAADAAAATSGQPARDQEEADKMASSLAKVRLNNNSIQSFGELDKLRDRQRTEIYRNNQARAAQGLPTPGIYSDLQGINFSQNLPQPMDPKHAVETRDTYEQGSLSEYSDYTSSDEEDYSRNPTSSTGGNRAWKDFVQEEEANRGSLLDDDPFGDAAQVDADTPGAYDRPRAHVWAEI